MRIGVPREIKPSERRVSLTPAGVRELVSEGHSVRVESGAGVGSGFSDDAYVAAGAVVGDAASVWQSSDLVVKVKEPLPEEFGFLRADLILFTYLHLAANDDLTEELVRSGSCAIAYETVEDGSGRLPLLAPMSEIAGRLAAQAVAYFLQSPQGGNGVLVGGAPGVAPSRIVVLGGGTAGTHAARVAVGLGSEVTILERSLRRIRELEDRFDGRARVLMSDSLTVEAESIEADAVIGAVLVPGARAPRLITESIVTRMRKGSLFVDVAIDQGGCAETSRPTTHEAPTYRVHDVVHYCVTNMPGAVPSTATRALTNATLPYVSALASLGVEAAIADDPGLAAGVNVRAGRVMSTPVAATNGEFQPARPA
jgi:alanine dehydrogenase